MFYAKLKLAIVLFSCFNLSLWEYWSNNVMEHTFLSTQFCLLLGTKCPANFKIGDPVSLKAWNHFYLLSFRLNKWRNSSVVIPFKFIITQSV